MKHYFKSFAIISLLISTVAFSQSIININTADATTLQSNLKELNAEQAQAIIKYRTANGPFKQVTDLQKVPGIDSQVFSQIKDQVKLEENTPLPSAPATES